MNGMTHQVSFAPPVIKKSTRFIAASIETIEISDMPMAVLKGGSKHHLARQNKSLKCDRRHKPIDDRQGHNGQRWPRYACKLEKCNRSKISNRTTKQTPRGIFGRSTPSVTAPPID
jgi:hypothetical protein